jgi:pyruvate, water dikinase
MASTDSGHADLTRSERRRCAEGSFLLPTSANTGVDGGRRREPMRRLPNFTTGLPDLDRVLHGILPGDNVVLQVDSVQDYLPFVSPFVRGVQEQGELVIYFRFAEHDALLDRGPQVEMHDLHPGDGFEAFLSEIFNVIERHGRGACYVFDCLSDLAVDWYSDRMLANFFMLTCPHLYDYETVTYFALLRNRHTALATSAIHSTAQIVVDVRRHRTRLYVQPRKVFERHSPTMYMLHAWDGDSFRPVTQSVTLSDIVASTQQDWSDFAVSRQDYWTRTFADAEALLDAPLGSAELETRRSSLVRHLCRMVISRDPRVLGLAERTLDLQALVDIGRRLIGTGMIGGKSVGMLLARTILLRANQNWGDLLEAHDSFFIGSDIFYTYLIANQCWWPRRQLQRDKSGTFEQAPTLRERLESGRFSGDVVAQFREMLEYFGQSPIIVRSSSLLEDAYGNAFSGKYESVFCANQGTPDQRLAEFLAAVRHVYASTMQEEALAYRAHYGLLDRDEQMALLVQRVSGSYHDALYFPDVGGVGFSYNPFVWSSDIDPNAGMMRLVFGLGTRAVDRHDDDYTRIVALNAPHRRPDSAHGDVRRYSQRNVDILDLEGKGLSTARFEDVALRAPEVPLSVFASIDEGLVRYSRERGLPGVFSRILTFDGLLTETDFVADIRRMLQTLQAAYQHPVDVEFAVNFEDEHRYRIHLLQCRPFQVRGDLRRVRMPAELAREHTLFETDGPIIGNSVATHVDAVIFVVPRTYGRLSLADRYSVARLIGRITRHELLSSRERPVVLLLGPGRWATTTPALGVPVSFAEISSVSAVCEIAEMHEGLVPDISLGTHFFNDLVELDMLYLAIHPDRPASGINVDVICRIPNALVELVPEAAVFDPVVHVALQRDAERIFDGYMALNVDALAQRGVLHIRGHRRSDQESAE